ncbi:MAG: aminotransferase class I/II-fold pyridoxal phosphate-dependent enzyme [Alphaproteobacteria bacterium]|nr:aminotransferase class I/II-fold pyridoxal phosphate-dependent enzyme [Alphaproteobacteria bacterium]
MTRVPPKISRRSDIPAFRVMDVMTAAAALEVQGRRVIHMEVGEPGLPTPAPVVEAAERAMRDGRGGYTVALGLPALRERIAQHYAEAYGVAVGPGRVVVTTGSSAAFSLAFTACFDIGDRMAIGRPCYPPYERIMRALGIEAVELRTTLADNFQPTAAQVAATPELQGLLVASPSNPTGTTIDGRRMGGLAGACAERGIRLISDEIYHRMVFDGGEVTALAFSDDAVAINSFSKYYCMTGWRVGWMVVPEALVRPVERLAQNLFISPPTVAQHAALAAFDCTAELDARVAQYRANRDLLLAELEPLGLRFANPEGAFYLYADVSWFTNDSAAFCRAMLEGAGVATVPGTDFDEVDGDRFIRLCFSGTAEDMAEAARRLKDWLPAQR